MTQFSSHSLTQSINRILADIDLLTDNDALEIKPERLDVFARSISTHLKALQDLDAYNKARAQQEDNQKYTSYEDLPPPSPADQERFRERVKSLIGQIEAGEPLPPIAGTSS